MINFCTLFDSNYLTRGLALHESLRKSCPSFHLYVIAFNQDCYEFLQNANLEYITPISLKDFEDEELLRVKPSRSAAEYCWTCTPSIILFCLRKYNLPVCTYIDADMIFYSNPQVLLDEMNDKSVLISEHRYSKEYDRSKTHGIYCVQFTCFKNDSTGNMVLQWWRERCLEWCFSYLEDGKFGDQKYLDDWTTRFPGIHVVQHPGAGIAPWNLQQYNFRLDKGQLIITNKSNGRSDPLIFFHFHGVKFYTNHMVSFSGALYEMNSDVKELIYIPYIKKLLEIESQLKNQGLAFNASGARDASLGKWNVFVEYFRLFMILVLKGKASPLKLKNYNFRYHYHFYKTDIIKQYGSYPGS